MNILGQPLFYHPYTIQSECTLSEEESRHCVASMRMKEKDVLFLTNGKGQLARVEMVSANQKAAIVRVLELEQIDKKKVIRRLIVAPPKAGERLDWMVEKAVEVGVDNIIFVETRFSERDKVNLERLNKIAVSAMKQSKQAYLPQLVGMLKWKNWISSQLNGIKLIAHVSQQGEDFVSLLSKEMDELSVLIGPEGDFSQEEVQQALQNGFVPVTLGNSVLRTETAAIYSLVCLNAFI